MKMKLGVPQTSQSIISIDCMTARSRSICRSAYAAQKRDLIVVSSSEGMTAWLSFKEHISIFAGPNAFSEFATSHELGPDSSSRHSQKRHVGRTRVMTSTLLAPISTMLRST